MISFCIPIRDSFHEIVKFSFSSLNSVKFKVLSFARSYVGYTLSLFKHFNNASYCTFHKFGEDSTIWILMFFSIWSYPKVLIISVIIAPLPGPISTKFICFKFAYLLRAVQIHTPIISPNIYVISGEVVKSPPSLNICVFVE